MHAPGAAELESSSRPQVEPRRADDGPGDSVRLVTRILPVGEEAPSMARETVAPFTEMLGSELARDTQLLISELITHRVRLEREGELRLDLSVSSSGVRVQVTDDRRGAPPPLDSREPKLGFELHIIAQVADRWGIRRTGQTTIWFELDR
jgi:hypothetical protein